MQYNPATAQTLTQCFLQTLVPDLEPRKQAEDFLRQASAQPGYAITILQLVSDPNANDQVRQAAAVNFKNHVRTHWAPPADPDADAADTVTVIQPPEKEQIKTLIARSMLSSQPRIQSQLSEALAIISKHDFPKNWPTLLPELVANLHGTSDYSVINGILGTANSIFKKFRYQYKSNELYIDLKYCLDNFAAPLLDIFLRTGQLIVANVSNAVVLKPLFECQRLCCRVFYSLNFQELPEFFENHMKEWMTEFRVYLRDSYPAIEDAQKENIVDDLRAAVCENINLYMEKNEEEFQEYLKDFATEVWGLLIKVSTSASRDKLAVTAIRFLTTVSKSVHHGLFNDAGILRQICESIVIPNVMLRDDDEELFEMNHVEYIRRDIEGSDLDTRRRIACELVKGLASHYKEQVISTMGGHIQSMQSNYTANPAQNWKLKDCAIYLVVSLANKQGAGMAVCPGLVNFDQFVVNMIVPEITNGDVNAQPVLKADALKFITTFRYQLSRESVLGIMPDLMRFLVSESNVVHSYAANCIEKILLIKDDRQSRFKSADIAPFVQPLLGNLFTALKLPESHENSYVMKCIMRVVGMAELSGEIAVSCLTELISILNEVCKNPKNPTFNHYLFETVAGLLRRSCERDPNLISNFEMLLFPVLQTILVHDVTEFVPYTLQLLAQLIEIHRPPLPDTYTQIFELLLSPDTWQKKGNVPALVRLLQAYLEKSHQNLNEGRLSQVLAIFNKLIAVRSTDHLGFFILNTIVENLSYGTLRPYIGHIWSALFYRLQNQRTVKFIKSFVIFMSLFLVKHGQAALVESINSVQADIFPVILEQFFASSLKSISGVLETKLCAVASARLLCECPLLQSDANLPKWGKLLDSAVSMLARPEEERAEEDTDVPELEETSGYTPAFAQLYNAGKKEEDPLKEIRDAKEFLVSSLARLSMQSPGRYPIVIQQSLEAANSAALAQFCSSYGCSIV